MTNEMKNMILGKSTKLIELYKKGSLGGEIMPEDANPGLGNDSKENYIYFTLPMALNYQRNSYKLWESALMTYNDAEVSDVFVPEYVIRMDSALLREKLAKYRVAIQPNKQPEIWRKICVALCQSFEGDVRNLFTENENSVVEIKKYIISNKKMFPYLSGPKILNYWLYVMSQYTDTRFIDREEITVAPDTHVIQASVKLGLIEQEDVNNSNIREYVSELWKEVFADTEYCPIDIHTPLWLWSRNGFSVEV